MATLTGGRGWLNDDAAASIHRIDGEIGRLLQITSAGRTWAEQAELYDGWINGRPGYYFAAPPGTSPHEAGNAIDTNDRFLDVMNRHGWRRPLSQEPWHFVYWPNLDNHINDPAGTGSSATATDQSAVRRRREAAMYVRGTTKQDVIYAVYTDAKGLPRMRTCGEAEAAFAREGGLVVTGTDGTLTMLAGETRNGTPDRSVQEAVWVDTTVQRTQGKKTNAIAALQELADIKTALAPKG